MNQLVQWNPFNELANVHRQMTALFDPASNSNGSSAPVWEPVVDIFEDNHGYIFVAELPGVRKDDVNVQLEDGVLVISGERRTTSDLKVHRYHRIERAFGAFARRFELPDDIDGANINATFKDGVLTVTVAKADHAKPRKIEVRVA